MHQICKDYGQTPSSYLFEGVILSSHEKLAIDKEVLTIARDYENKLKKQQENRSSSFVKNKHPNMGALHSVPESFHNTDGSIMNRY